MTDRTWKRGSASVADCLLRPGDDQPTLSAEARLVYLTLFSYMGDDDTCRPAVATIAAGTGLSERTIQRRIAELEAAGLVESDRIEIARRGAVGRLCTVYRLYPPWAPKGCHAVTHSHKGRQADTLSIEGRLSDTLLSTGENEGRHTDTLSPEKGCHAVTGDSLTPFQKGDSQSPVTDSRQKGDSLTPQVTQWSNPLLTSLPPEEHARARAWWGRVLDDLGKVVTLPIWLRRTVPIASDQGVVTIGVQGSVALSQMRTYHDKLQIAAQRQSSTPVSLTYVDMQTRPPTGTEVTVRDDSG